MFPIDRTSSENRVPIARQSENLDTDSPAKRSTSLFQFMGSLGQGEESARNGNANPELVHQVMMDQTRTNMATNGNFTSMVKSIPVRNEFNSADGLRAMVTTEVGAIREAGKRASPTKDLEQILWVPTPTP